jgi:hypothetical protein
LSSKIIGIFKEYQNPIITSVLFIKLVVFGLSWTDCLGTLILLGHNSVFKWVSYRFPERPDVYTALDNLTKGLNQLLTKTEGLESDVNGLKLGKGLKG